MTSMRSWMAAIAAALALALSACGGGDDDDAPFGGAPTTPGAFANVVSFGDSLSDVGTYAPATSLAGNGTPPFFGGRFTANSETATVWVENVATALGVPLTAAEMGFGTSSVKCPVAAAAPASSPLASSCTAYGQGGARVTDPNGIGRAGGALTVPVATQIANHVARFGGFDENDLVLVFAGHNDVLVQFSQFAAAAQDIRGRAAAGQLSPGDANGLLLQAQGNAQLAVMAAARELAGYVATEILGRGARYVAVMNVVDIADTPFGASLPADARPALSDLSIQFNAALAEALSGQPVRIVDTFALGKTVTQNPAQFGIANNAVPACDPARISALTGGRETSGSSLFCNSTPGAPFNGLRAGADVATWQFADGIHPTPFGHRLISDAVLEQLRAFGWIV